MKIILLFIVLKIVTIANILGFLKNANNLDYFFFMITEES